MSLLDSTRTLGVPSACLDMSLGDSSVGGTFGRGGSTITDTNTDSDMTSDITSCHIANTTGKLGEYQLQVVIGSGKFSTVWKALHMPSNTLVALKKVQIFEMMDQKQRTDCINEVKLLQSLDHPNIIKYLDSFMENNELVIVLEYAEGGDLGKLIKQRSEVLTPFSEGEIWVYFAQLCSAVSHMHAHRIMHRDIKPSNIFITAQGSLKVGDLGLSRYFSSKTAQAQSMVGTPYYMSPECIRGQPYDWSSDTWSLGCLLYELSALRNPFYKTGLNYYTLGKLITSCQFDPLPQHSSTELKHLVAKMVQQDANNRPHLHEISRFAEQFAMQYSEQWHSIAP